MNYSKMSNLSEDIAYCEGNMQPLESDRTAELAMECWNLRKTVLEQSSSTIRIKNEIKSQRNLVKNLQKLVGELQTDNLAKGRELFISKTKYLELEKRLHDQVLTTNSVSGSLQKCKRQIAHLQQKLSDQESETKAVTAKQ